MKKMKNTCSTVQLNAKMQTKNNQIKSHTYIHTRTYNLIIYNFLFFSVFNFFFYLVVNINQGEKKAKYGETQKKILFPNKKKIKTGETERLE